MRNSELFFARKNTLVKFEHFNMIQVLGRGTFGKVYLAELTGTKQLFAVKAIRKDVILEYD